MSDIPHAGDLPPCPFSKHCERLLDVETELTSSFPQDETLQDREDQYLLEQLQAHVPHCRTCSTILAQERARRTKQRQLLHQFLANSEQQVPSTAARVMQALSREREVSSKIASNGHTTIQDFPRSHTQNIRDVPNTRRVRAPSYLIPTLVAVLAIILVSAGLFSHMFLLRGSAGSGVHVNATLTQSVATTAVSHSVAWSSIVVAVVRDQQKLIMTMDPLSGKSSVLATSRYPDGTVIDGVSHDGYQVLYHVFDGTETQYYLQPSSTEQNAVLYTLRGKGGPAIWSTDGSFVFISTPVGVEHVAVNSRSATLAFSSSSTLDLRFYRDGYLYFATTTDANVSTGLNRIALSNGEVAPITTQCKLPYDFWLSPDGTTIYYNCGDLPGLYAVKSDGTGGYTVRTNTGQMIGYAAQGEPLLLQNAGSTSQVIELGVDAQHDRILVSNVAPSATKLTPDAVAVAPYGSSLVALAYSADGSATLWYDDLITNKQAVVPTTLDARVLPQVVLGGWSRLGVI